MVNDDGVIGYWNNGHPIRKRDARTMNLDMDKFNTELTRAGFNTLRVQVVHINSYFAASRRFITRKALRGLVAWGAGWGVTICCGDFNGVAYRPSIEPQSKFTNEEQIENIKSPIVVEELQHILATVNKECPLTDRVGLGIQIHCRRLITGLLLGHEMYR